MLDNVSPPHTEVGIYAEVHHFSCLRSSDQLLLLICLSVLYKENGLSYHHQNR